jgi:hypothetical protein
MNRRTVEANHIRPKTAERILSSAAIVLLSENITEFQIRQKKSGNAIAAQHRFTDFQDLFFLVHLSNLTKIVVQIIFRHCERSEAIQRYSKTLDCFVISPRKDKAGKQRHYEMYLLYLFFLSYS